MQLRRVEIISIRDLIVVYMPVFTCALLLAAGCSSKKAGSKDDDPGGDNGGCSTAAECSFGQTCMDGACSSDVPPPITDDGCLSNADCLSTEECAVSSGACVPVVSDPIVGPDPTCTDGAQRPCGSKIGACEYGVETCASGAWGTCVGGIGPAAMETACNGIDDLCNGLDDSERDQDGDGQRPCAGDCDDFDADMFAGNTEVCDDKDNDCDGPVDEDTAAECDDGNPCTVDDACTVGVCVPGGNTCACGMTSDCPVDADLCNGTLICVGNDCVVDLTTVISCPGNTDCQTFACNPATGICDATAQPDGTTCEDGSFCTDGDTCLLGTCSAGPARNCDDAVALCTGTCDETNDVCVLDPLCNCNPNDSDNDGYSECQGDCDDTNGFVHPNATEFCNGIDDDCDGLIDEDFDMDMDTYSVCSRDPLTRDCDDTKDTVNPGAMEDCGPTGTGNGIDDDCDSLIDEGCNCAAAPANEQTDDDMDGFAECEGDCDDTDDTVYPGAAEVCDGLDNDCNSFTIANCGVSDQCRWPGDPDVCQEKLLCLCFLEPNGFCGGNHRCTSLCNSSQTGAIGDRCAADEICGLNVVPTSNVHGCETEVLTITNIKTGGVPCKKDEECRSNNCWRPISGPLQYCFDFCGSDAYCPAAGTVCRLAAYMDGVCWPTPAARVGPDPVGTACTSNFQCDHGYCVDDSGDEYCTEACCTDTDCGSGFTCSLRGDKVDKNTYFYTPPSATACTSNADCPITGYCYLSGGVCEWRMADSSPMCLKDVAGQGTWVGGNFCTTNSDCRSNFCELNLGVCIESCCSDASCPAGLTCELQVVETSGNRATHARVCVNISTEEVFRPR